MSVDLISDLTNLEYLSWTRSRNYIGTAGTFLKSYFDYGGKKIIINFLILILVKELLVMNV